MASLDSVQVHLFGLDLKYNPVSMGLRADIAEFDESEAEACGAALRVSYPAGQVRRGAGWYWNLSRRHITSSIRWPATTISKEGGWENGHIFFRVRFGDDFEFVQTGKLAGLAGGLANTGGLKPSGNDGWSARITWERLPMDLPGEAAAMLYLYHMDQPQVYGQVVPLLFDAPPLRFEPNTETILVDETGNVYDRLAYERVTFRAGQWYAIEIRVQVNTPGEFDGQAQVWINEVPVLSMRGLRFRSRDVKKEALRVKWGILDTIFGGNTPDFAPVKDEVAFFDDLIVSQDYIGQSYARYLCSGAAPSEWQTGGFELD